MQWNNHKFLKGSHAFLSPSQYSWLNYDPEKLERVYINRKNAVLGTKYHDLAQRCIQLAQRLPDTGAPLNSFVNDAIGFRMETEKMLFFSEHCYGTADAISYRDGVLRIHDLKTGSTNGSVKQVLVYAAIFCHEYDVIPDEIILRVYHETEKTEYIPDYDAVDRVIRKIEKADKILKDIESRS